MDRVLVLAAHPDDETIACSALLQRAATSMVVFAVDGAPLGYGFERKFASLQKYSETRFLEAARALSFVPRCSFQRLRRPNGSYFVDQHLFEDLQAAFISLLRIAGDFSANVMVSHAYEGGHIDHDACSFLAMQTARALRKKHLEFPLYWKSETGVDVFQEFRHGRAGEFALWLSRQELAVKQQMRAEYRSQEGIVRVFPPETERFRPVVSENYARPICPDYAFENRRRRLKADSFLRKLAEFEASVKVSAASR